MEKLVYIWLNDDYQAIIDANDFDLVSRYNWGASERIYKQKNKCYAVTVHNTNILSLHRLLMNPPPDMEVDHINGESLDNRRCNLRLATSSQNSMNIGIRSNNKTGYKGVSAGNGGYRACIQFQGIAISIGYYATAIEAAKAYDDSARKLHKEFAWLNFPDDP